MVGYDGGDGGYQISNIYELQRQHAGLGSGASPTVQQYWTVEGNNPLETPGLILHHLK